ncbi:MAG: hypothetical protein FWC11_01510 [Firmicutes bacterium]|nr:hypothetical protein [Bacillota bacterium]
MIKNNNDMEKNIQKKCHVCGQSVLSNKYGHTDPCISCGWENSNRSWDFPDRVINHAVVSLNKAKRLYSEGKPIKPNFDDFIDGLFFYSEMKFTYNNIEYGVYFVDNQISLFSEEPVYSSRYKDRNDFSANANINGIKLRDIWHEVEDASFML